MVVFVNIIFLKVVSNFFAFIFAFFKHVDFNLTNENVFIAVLQSQRRSREKNPGFESVNLDQLRLLYVDMWTVQYTHYSCECSALFMPKVLFITNVHYYLHAYHAIYVHV